MKFLTGLKKNFIEAWAVSTLAGFYYAMVSNGTLCTLLLNGDSFIHRVVLSAILGVVLWCVIVCLCYFAERFDKNHTVRNVLYSILNKKAACFFYVLTIFKLTQAAFYPLYADQVVYFVSRFLFGAYLAAIILSYVTGHEKFRKTVISSSILCFIGWCIARILLQWHAVYNGFYYLLLLVNISIVLWVNYNLTFKDCFLKIKGWILSNKRNIIICILAAVAGACVEVVHAYFNGINMLLPRCVFWAAVGLCLGICAILYGKKKCFVERAFLCVILIVGIYMAVFMPISTLVSWDDEIHYTNAVRLVQGENVTAADWTMAVRDTDWFWAYIEQSEMAGKISASATNAHIHDLSEKAKVLADNPWLGAEIQIYQTIGYIPNAIGLCVGQIINLPYGITFLLGRISAVVFYALVIFAAMKRLRSGKLLLAVVALLPTNLFQAANYSYDAWIVCMVAFAVSNMVSRLQDEQKTIQAKDVAVVLTILALAIAPKGIYFPLFLLLLLVPSGTFADTKKYRSYVYAVLGTLFICFIVYMLLPFLCGKNQGDIRFGTEVSAVGQIIHILKNPVTYAKNLILFLKGYLSLENSYDYTCFWSYLTSNRVDYHATLMVLLFVTAVIDRGTCDNAYCTVTVKTATTALMYVIAAMIATVLYLTCSPVGSDIINGCQARYLAPLVFPFMMLVCNLGAFQVKHRSAVQAVCLTISGYVLLVIVWSNIAGQYIV